MWERYTATAAAPPPLLQRPALNARMADTSAELVRYIGAIEHPEPVEEAVWEKILRLSGFRW